MPGRTENSISLGESDEDERDAREDEYGEEVEIDDEDFEREELRRDGILNDDRKAKSKSTKPAGKQSKKGATADSEEGPEKKPRKPIVRANLNADRLAGPLGLPALLKDFTEVQWQGPGHELEDFRLMMRKMENWAHSMYPKFKFDDVLQKVEKLGTKKAVKTCIKKMLADMPVLAEDFVSKPEMKPAEPLVHLFNRSPPRTSTPSPFHDYPDLEYDDYDSVVVESRNPAAQFAVALQGATKVTNQEFHPAPEELDNILAAIARKEPSDGGNNRDTLDGCDDVEFEACFSQEPSKQAESSEKIGMEEAFALIDAD